MGPSLHHPADGEAPEALGAVDGGIDLEAEHGEALHTLGDADVGLQVLGEPRKGELHEPRPPTRLGTSRAANP